MPYDDLTLKALAAVAGARDDYRSALIGTVDQLRGLLEAGSGDPDTGLRKAAAELGSFAGGHIDVEKFASLFTTGQSLDEASRVHLERAIETLESLAAREDDLFVARVPKGSDLPAAVSRLLAEAGRAFGAARTAELARTGRFRADDHKGWIDHFPASLWSRREREIAPPLVLRVDGCDLRAGGLADFLDGSQKLVLLVDGAAPAAALVPCVTPGVHVLQTDDPEQLARSGQVDGPAIAALVPAGCARFEHRPGPDGPVGLRLSVAHLPDEEPKRTLGGISAFRQAEELRQLRSLAAGPAPAFVMPSVDGEARSAPATDADLLAAWILHQAGPGSA
jgi:hypothetical protein